jgi:hypothetical protein
VYQILFYQIFFIDWAAKKELFIAMMLRAYSQEVFNPQSVFEEEDSEIGFTNRIEGFMKDFIINQLAGDTNAIRKEVERLIIKCTYLYIYIYILGHVHVQRDQGQHEEKINQEIGEKRDEDEGYG